MNENIKLFLERLNQTLNSRKRSQRQKTRMRYI